MRNCYEKGCRECLGAMLENAGRFFDRMTSDDKLINECQQTFEAENKDGIQEIIRVLRAGHRSPEKLEIRELSGGYFGETRSLSHTQVIKHYEEFNNCMEFDKKRKSEAHTNASR